jgi:hypothetical protein
VTYVFLRENGEAERGIISKPARTKIGRSVGRPQRHQRARHCGSAGVPRRSDYVELGDGRSASVIPMSSNKSESKSQRQFIEKMKRESRLDGPIGFVIPPPPISGPTVREYFRRKKPALGDQRE